MGIYRQLQALGVCRYFLPSASSPSVACLTITSGPFVLPIGDRFVGVASQSSLWAGPRAHGNSVE